MISEVNMHSEINDLRNKNELSKNKNLELDVNSEGNKNIGKIYSEVNMHLEKNKTRNKLKKRNTNS